MSKGFEDLGFEPEQEEKAQEFGDLGFEQESIPMGGELSLSEVASQEMAVPSTKEMPLPEVSQPEALLEGTKQGVTFGFADELGGITQEFLDMLKGEDSPTAMNRRLAEQGFTGDIGPTSRDELYEEGVAEGRTRLAAAEEQHPVTTMAGDIAGGFLVPGGLGKTVGKTIPQAIKQASKVKRGAAAGAGVGAVEAAGRTEEDLTTAAGAADVAMGAAGGGLLGAAAGKVGQKLESGKMAEDAKKLEREANIKAAAGIGAKPSDMAQILGTKTRKSATVDEARDVGKTLVDEGIFKVKQSADELKQDIVNKMEEVATQRMQPAAQQADDLVGQIPIENFADDINTFVAKVDDDITELVEGAKYAKQSDKLLYKNMEETSQKIKEDVDNALGSGKPISELVDIKRKLQGQINWKDPAGSAYNEYLVKAQKNIDSLINDMTKKASPEVAEQMSKANKTYSDLTIANKIAGDELARESVKTSGIGWKDYFLGGAIGAATKSPAVGALAVAGKKATEKITGKETGKMMESMEALHKFKKARKMADRAKELEDPTTLERFKRDRPGTTAVAATTTGAAGIEAMTEEDRREPYKVHQRVSKMIQRATPDMIEEQAQTIRSDYGENGERLAQELEKMTGKDKMQRTAIMFKIMQNPEYKKMLMPELYGEK